MPRHTRFFSLAALFLAFALLLAGCGQKGDLYHPDEEPEKQPPTAQR